MDIARNILTIIQVLLSLGLIAIVVAQSSRSEGLGAVGGGSTPTPRGRQGAEEQLAFFTKWIAGAWMVICLLQYLLSQKYGWS